MILKKLKSLEINTLIHHKILIIFLPKLIKLKFFYFKSKMLAILKIRVSIIKLIFRNGLRLIE